MKIELKNIKIAQWASEETTCYHADVFIDGKKAIHAQNAGHGGCDEFHFYDGYAGPNMAKIDAWLADNVAPSGPYESDPAKRAAYDNGSLCDLESFIGEKIADWEIEKDIKRKAKKLMSLEDGKIYSWKVASSPAILAQAREKYPDKEFINDRLDDADVMARARIAMGGPSRNDADAVHERNRENRLTSADARWLLAQDFMAKKPCEDFQNHLRGIIAQGDARADAYKAEMNAKRDAAIQARESANA